MSAAYTIPFPGKLVVPCRELRSGLAKFSGNISKEITYLLVGHRI